MIARWHVATTISRVAHNPMLPLAVARLAIEYDVPPLVLAKKASMIVIDKLLSRMPVHPYGVRYVYQPALPASGHCS